MNMDETKLYSWFLGPKAENADMLERLVLEALRDCVFWRRNFHPEDDIIITYSVFDLNVQVESTTGATGITGKSKTKHPRVPVFPVVCYS